MIKTILKYIGILILGAVGAFIFELFVFPFLLSDPYFENFRFVKNFNEGKLVVNQTQQIYIQENTALENAVKNAQKSVVGIQKNGVVAGSGLVVASDGSVLTLNSLVSAPGKISDSEGVLNYKIVKRDAENNLALVKIGKNGLLTVGFADPEKIMPGQRIFLLGVLQDGSNFADEGIIRSRGETTGTNIFEKNIASGAPLFNVAGELVGISFIGQDGRVFAIPVDKIKQFLGL